MHCRWALHYYSSCLRGYTPAQPYNIGGSKRAAVDPLLPRTHNHHSIPLYGILTQSYFTGIAQNNFHLKFNFHVRFVTISVLKEVEVGCWVKRWPEEGRWVILRLRCKTATKAQSHKATTRSSNIKEDNMEEILISSSAPSCLLTTCKFQSRRGNHGDWSWQGKAPQST